MSYYIVTYEIPNGLLEKLKAFDPDSDKQEETFYDWRNTITQVAAAQCVEAP